MPECPHCGSGVSPNELVYEQNSFRENAESEQQSFDEICQGTSVASVENAQSVWEYADTNSDGSLGVDLQGEYADVRFGEVLNENDPAEW